PVNVVGRGAASPWQAARLGGRIPVPVLGPGWDAARRIAEVAGAPVPPHVPALMQKGRAGAGAPAPAVLAVPGLRSPRQSGAALQDRVLRRAVRVGHGERAAPGRGRRVTASTDPVPDVAADDRVQPLDSPLAFARRRLDGRFQIDAFGGDAQLMDLAGRALA